MEKKKNNRLDEIEKIMTTPAGKATPPSTEELTIEENDGNEETQPTTEMEPEQPATPQPATRKENRSQMEPYSLMVEKELIGKFLAVAEITGVSTSALIRQAMSTAMEKYESENGQVVPKNRSSRIYSNSKIM